MTDPDLLGRIDNAERRLSELAENPPPGLTDADPSTGERWDAGQAWAHLAEFVPYWQRQADAVLAAVTTDPVPFGRTKADAGRIAAIEAARQELPGEQMGRLRVALAEFRDFSANLSEEGWARVGLHPTRGAMSVTDIVREFVVAHLEEHVEQLERLKALGDHEGGA